MAQEFTADNYHQFITARLKEEYYSTALACPSTGNDPFALLPRWDDHRTTTLDPVRVHYSGKYGMNRYGKTFGSIACRNLFGEPGFYTTARVKTAMFADTFKITEKQNWSYVLNVDHNRRVVEVATRKATLNAPLFDHLFRIRPEVKIIVHYHELGKTKVELGYATPGTVQDSIRAIPDGCYEFEIIGHGVYRLFRSVEDALAFDPYA